MIKKLRQFATNLLIMSKEVFEKVYEAANENRIFEAVYNEYGKLDEMHPKLRALIAAGLIGTAGIGMQSCNMAPEDDTYYEMPSGEEKELKEFKQKCDEYKISPELGVELRDKLKGTISTVIPKEDFDSFDDSDPFKLKIYEEGEGFVPYEKSSLQEEESYIVQVGNTFYYIPTDCTVAYKLFGLKSAE